ncbi:MerR family transcriptional regulator [Sanguibacter sp. 25GB23B1]|uniref:MerR family transcriptional regulator n=1 Tax=unclassified Sanguibacter TaxID=2645534 RepID=UPI0032AF5396
MTTTMTIGDFSRATRLSAKALRFYHQVGLLEPVRVDASSGYRLYAPEQIADAQVIRTLRSLDVPVDHVREILAAPGVAERNAVIAAHLDRMEARLEETRAAVSSLRGLLETPAETPVVRYRSVPPTPVVLVRETIDLSELGDWYTAATRELSEVVERAGIEAAGPRGGLWETALFLDERGDAALYVPVHDLGEAVALTGRARAETLQAVDLAVATHRGRDATVPQVYGALGAHVARHELGIEGPVRETYLQYEAAGSEAVTEIGWPIFRTVR